MATGFYTRIDQKPEVVVSIVDDDSREWMSVTWPSTEAALAALATVVEKVTNRFALAKKMGINE